MCGFRAKRDERPRVCRNSKAFAKVAEHKRTATIIACARRLRFKAQKYDGGNQSLLCLETSETGISVLVCDEEVSLTIAKKLWILTLFQANLEVFLNLFFAAEQFLSNEGNGLNRRLNAKRSANRFVDRS